MPLTAPSDPVQESALPATRVSVSASPDAFGTAYKSAPAASALVDAGARYADEQTSRANQLAVLDADRKASELETNLQYHPQTGFFNVRGKDAMGLPEKVKESWDKGSQDIASTLGNDVQRRAFAGMQTQRWDDLNKHLQHHVATEIKSYDDETTNSYISNEQNAAAMNYLDVPRIAMSIERQKASLADYANRNGMGADWLQEKVADSTSKTHTAVIDRMLANDQDVTAKKYYDANKDEIAGKDATVLDKALEEGSLRGGSQRAVDAIMGQNLSRTEALDQVEKIDDPKLRDATETRLIQAYNQKKAAEKQDQEDLYDKASNLLDSAPRGAPARDVIPPSDWTKLSLEQKNALQKRAENPPNDDQKWLDFLDLSPKELQGLSKPDFETKYWANFDQSHRDRAETLWNQATSGKGKAEQFASTLTFNQRVDNTLRTSGLLDPNKSKAKMTSDEATLYANFDTEAARQVQDFEVNQLGGKRKATGEEMQKIMDGIALQKVFIAKPWYQKDVQQPAALVTNDDKGNAYVPIKSIPAPALLALKTEAQNMRVRPADSAFEKAYAAVLTGERDDEKIRDILRRRD